MVVAPMIFAFTSSRLRNFAGRSARGAGYRCIGAHTREEAFLLTVDELDGGRRGAAEQLIRQVAPTVSRLS